MTVYITHGSEYLTRRLREHRYRLGLGLAYVANAVNISVEDLTQYEYGQKPITQKELLKLANLYRVSPVYFLGGVPF
jgi:transcriptional regulator with XRE-family HTH domain